MRLLRILVVHPLAPVLAAVAASQYLGASPRDSATGLNLLALATLVTALLTGVMLLRSSESRVLRAGLVVLSFGIAVATASGVLLVYEAIELACEDRADCPI